MKIRKQDKDRYFREVRTWETDQVLREKKSRVLAWRIAVGSLMLAGISISAVAFLTPLKTVEPFVIRVDNSTGIVDIVTTLKNQKSDYNEAVNKYFVQRYIRAREGYLRETADLTYREVGLMSAPKEQQIFFAEFDPKNPNSPLRRYGSIGKVNIQIKSVSLVKKGSALVRYTREVDGGGGNVEVSHWIATVQFHYQGAPLSEADRAINPLGFQVTYFRTDPESMIAVGRKAAAQRIEPRIEPSVITEDAPAEAPTPTASGASDASATASQATPIASPASAQTTEQVN